MEVVARRKGEGREGRSEESIALCTCVCVCVTYSQEIFFVENIRYVHLHPHFVHRTLPVGPLGTQCRTRTGSKALLLLQ
jgi:hypothetical protein